MTAVQTVFLLHEPISTECTAYIAQSTKVLYQLMISKNFRNFIIYF